MNIKVGTKAYVCMPLKKNVPEGLADWELTTCPDCGEQCWKRPMQEQLESIGYIAVCTLCAIRKEGQP